MYNNNKGYYGIYGGQFIPETLYPAIKQLEDDFESLKNDNHFLAHYVKLLKDFSGRPTSLFHANNLSDKWRANIYLKREDLNHTGSHKINNALGQGLIALHSGKKRLIAETGAGQHGVATATAAALLGLSCTVYMGKTDKERQEPNVKRMEILGAEVRTVEHGSKTLKDAINEAIRDWVTNVNDSYYLIGSAVGPHPYPSMVKYFQSIIGTEAKSQILEREASLPDAVIACVGGGSNAIGIFSAFENHEKVSLIGVEALGKGHKIGEHASSLNYGSLGVLHGAKTKLLHDQNGQVTSTHSISAGLDYPAVGPEHAFLHESNRATYTMISDKEALEAVHELSRYEGIIPALESAHAVAYAKKYAVENKGKTILINLSGRGDKDISTIISNLSEVQNV